MYECTRAEVLWKKLGLFFTKYMLIETQSIDFNFENVFINRVHRAPNHVINFMILVTKQYLYTSKCLKKTPSFVELLLKIEELRKIEMYNAKVKNTMNTHTRKWAPYEDPKVNL